MHDASPYLRALQVKGHCAARRSPYHHTGPPSKQSLLVSLKPPLPISLLIMSAFKPPSPPHFQTPKLEFVIFYPGQTHLPSPVNKQDSSAKSPVSSSLSFQDSFPLRLLCR